MAERSSVNGRLPKCAERRESSVDSKQGDCPRSRLFGTEKSGVASGISLEQADGACDGERVQTDALDDWLQLERSVARGDDDSRPKVEDRKRSLRVWRRRREKSERGKGVAKK